MTERRETDREDATPAEGDGERIAKYLARAGVASRREVERMIADGRVAVEGVVLDSPAFKVSGRERIAVDGQAVLRPDRTRLWRYHKPIGLVTTNSDPEGRPTVFDALPVGLPRVITIGRLDLNTEGLLLLTNDGEFARRLELPANGLERRYRARAYGRIEQAELDRLLSGVVHEGVVYRPIQARLVRQTGSNSWIEMTLTEGKKREARRALESLGLKVNRLIRTAYGPVELGDLKPGEVAEVPARDIRAAFGQAIGREPGPAETPRPSTETDARPQRRRAGGAGKARRPAAGRART